MAKRYTRVSTVPERPLLVRRSSVHTRPVLRPVRFRELHTAAAGPGRGQMPGLQTLGFVWGRPFAQGCPACRGGNRAKGLCGDLSASETASPAYQRCPANGLQLGYSCGRHAQQAAACMQGTNCTCHATAVARVHLQACRSCAHRGPLVQHSPYKHSPYNRFWSMLSMTTECLKSHAEGHAQPKPQSLTTFAANYPAPAL